MSEGSLAAACGREAVIVRVRPFYSAPSDDRPILDAPISAVGLRPMYVGENQQDVVDGVLRLWFALAVTQGHGRNLAFHTLTREAA